MKQARNINALLINFGEVVLLLQLLLACPCTCDGDHDLHQWPRTDVVYSYIGNFIITREAIFLISIVALVISWRALVHVVFHKHRVIKKLRDNLPDMDYFMDQWAGVFDQAMNLYKYDEDDGDGVGVKGDDDDFNYYYDHDESFQSEIE